VQEELKTSSGIKGETPLLELGNPY